jgi:predicted membrane protein
VLGFTTADGGTSVAAWNTCVVAIVIAILSIAALARAEPWEEWVNILAGIWLFISPWVLKFSATRPALWNALIVGALVIIFAAWDLGAMQQASGRRV